MDLDFLVPKQVTLDAHTLSVTVHPSPEIFTDHEDYVHVLLYPLDTKGRRGKIEGALAENARVQLNEEAVHQAIATLARSSVAKLERLAKRERRLRIGT